MKEFTIAVGVILVFEKVANKNQLYLDGSQLVIRKKWSVIAVGLEPKAPHKFWCITWTAISIILNCAISKAFV